MLVKNVFRVFTFLYFSLFLSSKKIGVTCQQSLKLPVSQFDRLPRGREEESRHTHLREIDDVSLVDELFRGDADMSRDLKGARLVGSLRP